MDIWETIKNWIDYNRGIVIAVIIALGIWIGAISCTPETESPTRPGQLITAKELEIEYLGWQNQVTLTNRKFEIAEKDLEEQAEKMAQLEKLILDLATGAVPASVGSLAQILITGGFLGFAADNIRKRGLIAGLKRNKSPTE